MKWMSLIVISCFYFFAQGQNNNYVKGYVIDLNQDTIQGFVKLNKIGLASTSSSRVKFKSDQFIFSKRYSPNQILGYGFDNEHFVSLAISTRLRPFKTVQVIDESVERQFLRVVKRSDKLTYYESFFTDEDNDDLNRVPYFHIPYRPEMVRVTQGIFGLKKNRLSEYFEHCPELVEAINGKKITEPIQVYNYYVTKCK